MLSNKELNTLKEARRQLDMAIATALEPFNMYGLGDNIPSAHKAIKAACEQYAQCVKSIKLNSEV